MFLKRNPCDRSTFTTSTGRTNVDIIGCCICVDIVGCITACSSLSPSLSTGIFLCFCFRNFNSGGSTLILFCFGRFFSVSWGLFWRGFCGFSSFCGLVTLQLVGRGWGLFFKFKELVSLFSTFFIPFGS